DSPAERVYEEQAAFRIDYPVWLSQLGHRNRRIAEDMALDHSTRELAARHRLSQGRISQLRREFHLDWRWFHAELCGLFARSTATINPRAATSPQPPPRDPPCTATTPTRTLPALRRIVCTASTTTCKPWRHASRTPSPLPSAPLWARRSETRSGSCL